MFVPTNELVLAELGSAMGANDCAETNLLRMVDIPFSDILPIAGDDEITLTEARMRQWDSAIVRDDGFELVFPCEVDELFRVDMAICQLSIDGWDGTMDANL